MTVERNSTGENKIVFYTPWEERMNKNAAHIELYRFRQAESVAARSETLAERRTDLSPREIVSMRELQRMVFRKITGIEFEQRHVMRQWLEEVERTGDYTVDELRQRLRRHFQSLGERSD